MSAIALCAAVLLVIAVILVRHKKYDDGLIGRIALAGVILSCLMVLLVELISVQRYSAPPELVMLLASICVFMLRHLWRFMQFSRPYKRPTFSGISPIETKGGP